jgi:S-formylglutathione hydrolase FrmB
VCKKIFNISAKREDTAIMGCSMGGHGALWFALTFPEQYGFCGAIAPACLNVKEILEKLSEDPSEYLETGQEAVETLTDLYAIYGDALGYRKDYDVTYLANNFPKNKPMPKIFATCGIEDNLRDDNLIFRDMMKNSKFDFSYEEWTGGHDWVFFSDALKRTIEVWYGEG